MPKVDKKNIVYNLNSSFAAHPRGVYDSSLPEKLVTWVRMKNSGNPDDLGPYNLSPTYENSPTLETVKLGNRVYPSVTLSDSSNTSVQVISTDGHFSFTNLASGGTPASGTDRPFSISFWFKVSALPVGSAEHMISKAGGNPGSSDYEYTVLLFPSGLVQFTLSDEVANAAVTVNSAAGSVAAGKWYHVLCTYDGRGLSTANEGMTLYINGVESTDSRATSGGDFVGMKPYWPGILYIGGSHAGTYEFDGSLAEFAMWSKELSSDEGLAVYNGTAYGAYKLSSGYLTNPVRTIIRENDFRTGSYPTNLRTGDRDFSGKSTTGMVFDDTKAIDFVSPFASAEIKVQGSSSVLNEHRVGITSSDGQFTKDFEFLVSQDGDPGKVIGSKVIHLKSQFEASSGPPASQLTNSKSLAKKLANAINQFSGSLNMKASAVKDIVHLKSFIPLTGTLKQGNVITTGSTTDEITALNITQFSVTSNSKVSYPSKLKSSSRYANQNISNPNIAPTLTAYGDVIKGISDHGIHFTPGENISPFSDSRINIENTAFYASGSDPKIIENFSSPLRSKTQIVFNLKSSNGVGTHLFYSTGSPGPVGTRHPSIANKRGSGFSYWNNALKRWEMVNAIAGNEPRWNHSSTRLTGSVRGFTSPMYQGPINPTGWHRAQSSYTNKEIDEIINRHGLVAQPTNTSGFPSAQQYNATGSQCIRMSDFINSPFLLEKIRVDFKGNFGLDGKTAYAGISRLNFRKFFILCQPTDGDNPHTSETETIKVNEYENGATGSFTRSFSRRGKRELVAYSRICLARNENNYKNASAGKYQEFKNSFDKFIEYTATDVANYGLTSSFGMEMFPKIALNSDVTSFWNTAESNPRGKMNFSETAGNFAIDGNILGGADLLGNPSGRQIATSMDIADISTEITGTQSLGPFTIRHRSEYDKTSPYLLFPEDNLIFGWENIPEIVATNSEFHNADSMIDRITDIKITCFGSMIRDDKEFHDTLNQPLTSEGIHEALFGEHVIDQWDVEPLTMLSGSTRDALFFGDMKSTSTAQRGRRGSIAAGDAGNTGSLNRNVQFFEEGVIYSDSRVPNIGTFFSDFAPTLSGVRDASDILGSTYNLIPLTNRANTASSRLLRTTNIFSSRDIVSNLSSTPSFRPTANSSGNSSVGNNLDFPFLGVENTTPDNGDAAAYSIFGGGQTTLLGVNASAGASPETRFPAAPLPVSIQNMGNVPQDNVGTDFASTIVNENIRSLNKVFFGAPLISPLLGGIFKFPIISTAELFFSALRGFKFGFFNIFPTNPTYHFRRSSFGQFRDLMESPPEGKMNGLVDLADEDNGLFVADQNAETPPIKIIFMSRAGDSNISPLDTNTQNLSQFATSSEPYYDGISRERNFDKQPPPDLTNVIAIEDLVTQVIDGDA